MRKAHKILKPKTEIPIRPPSLKEDLLLFNAGEIVTLAGSDRPRRGIQMRELNIVHDGALYAQNGKIMEVGESKILQQKYSHVAISIDANKKLVVPGFVDPHTHLVFAGSREDEVEMKLQGATYQEIASSGGGLISTVKKTRAATKDELMTEASSRLKTMLSEGTTTIEAKSGYGLTIDDELKILAVQESLAENQAVSLVSTFLGAHAISPEFQGNADGYIEMMISEMLPQVARRTTAKFCDIWIEQGYFNVEHGRRLFNKAKLLGLAPKVHADELTLCGGTELAGEVEATSADHLIHVSDSSLEAISKTDCVGVLLPAASMSSKLPYADARRIINAGIPVAIGTDLNPGCWVESMQFVISLAVHELGMLPTEAVTAATINAAHAIGVGDSYGSLEPGKSADFVLLDLDSHRKIGYQFGGNRADVVVKSGRIVVDRRIR